MDEALKEINKIEKSRPMKRSADMINDQISKKLKTDVEKTGMNKPLLNSEVSNIKKAVKKLSRKKLD